MLSNSPTTAHRLSETDALAVLSGVGTTYCVEYDHDGRTGQFIAGMSGRPATFTGTWLECLAWAGNAIEREVEQEEAADWQNAPEGDRLAIVTPEGDVR